MSARYDGTVHPYAAKFPILPDDELHLLADDIRTNGLLVLPVLDQQGRLLAGRNRVAACEIAGVTPEFDIYEGDDPAGFVLSENVHRRHMSTGARAMSSALVLAEDGHRENGRWKRDSISQDPALSRGWFEALRQAGVVLDHAPSLADKVVSGHLALDAAYRQACEARDDEARKAAEQKEQAQRESEAKKFIRKNAPDLADQVGDDKPFLTFTEALAIWEQRNREEAARIAKEKADKAKREADERQARADLYGGMARAALTLGGYGRYDDIPKLMADFNRNELQPSQVIEGLGAENLQHAQRFIKELIDWTEEP